LRVVPWKQTEVALIAVASQVEMLAAALLVSSLTSLVVDSRACTRACHHMNASAPENAFCDCVIYGHGASGDCDILLPRDRLLPLQPAPCLSCSVGVCG
jgi:hypothetical protein